MARIFVFIFGSIIGSFLNVCIYRLPAEGYSLIRPGSHCPRCKKPIFWYDNIPILSYLILRGKCRRCGKAISIRYPLVELLTGVLFLGVHFYVVSHHLRPITIPFYWYFAASLLALSLIDVEHQIIPDRITYPLAALGLILAGVYPERFKTIHPAPALLRSLIGLAVGGMVLWLIGVIGKAVFKKEAMGFGDVKLMAAIGAWQGWQMVLLAIFLGAAAAAVVGVSLIIMKKARWGARLPFGPYLALGSLVTLFWGLEILLWYLKFYVHT